MAAVHRVSGRHVSSGNISYYYLIWKWKSPKNMQWSFGGDCIDRGRPWGRDRLPCDDRLATSIIKPNSWPFIPLNWIYSFALLSPRIIKYGLWNLKNLKNSFPLLLELLLKPNFQSGPLDEFFIVDCVEVFPTREFYIFIFALLYL